MSEQTVGRLRRDGGWDARYGKRRQTPRAIRSLPVGPADTRIPLVRLLNLILSMGVLWFLVALWALSLLMEGGAS